MKFHLIERRLYAAVAQNKLKLGLCHIADTKVAYKTCVKGVKKAYPYARYTVVDGFGHMTYSVKNTEEYLDMLRETLQ